MTNQEIFETVYKHLVAQGVQSSDLDGCKYRGPNGTMCAVGCLIKDEFYDKDIEQMTANSVRVYEAVSQSIGDYDDRTDLMLRELQKVHDDLHFRDQRPFKVKLDEFATKFGSKFDINLDFAV